MDRKIHRYHEQAYQKMKASGICCWEKLLSPQNKDIDGKSKRFLKDVFPKSWFPKKGKVVELGCGTGPILRWVCKKGFSGLGVDVSKTAIYLAKQQTKEGNIHFKKADVCSDEIKKFGKFDVIIDGHCLHCIVSVTERRRFFKNASKLLSKDGILIIMTMCGPINKDEFIKICRNSKISNNILYSKMVKNNAYMPIRKILPWKNIVTEIKKAGLDILLSRYIKPYRGDPFGSLMIAATK